MFVPTACFFLKIKTSFLKESTINETIVFGIKKKQNIIKFF